MILVVINPFVLSGVRSYFATSAVEGRISTKLKLSWLYALRLRNRRTLFLRSARRFLFILFSLFSFQFYNFMYLIKVTTNQCLFLCAAPTFDLSFPSQCM